MKIYNKEKTKVLENPDRDLGYLINDKLTIHHDAVEGVQEQGHYNVIAEYPNGGKDVEWVVDVPGVEAKEAYDETEEILVYIPYTEVELQKVSAQKRIRELKKFLADTDYKCMKHADGEISDEEYEEIKIQRHQWRLEIGEWEKYL